MSIGQRLQDDELSDVSICELYSILGEGDTPKLFQQRYTVDTDHDIPAGGGNSVDRRTKYIDRTLYSQAMDNEFKATGLTPQQVVDRWLEHEHCEKCIVDGDNPVDSYMPGHRRALRREHEGVLIILGRDDAKGKIERYEVTIWPALVRCYHRPVKKPPADLWCSPYLDDPTEQDEEILASMRRLGVVDAGRRSKTSVGYGYGAHDCVTCSMWSPQRISQEGGELAACAAVNGLVRADRGCHLWVPKKPTAGK